MEYHGYEVPDDLVTAEMRHAIAMQEARDAHAMERTKKECETKRYAADRQVEAEKIRARGGLVTALVAGGFTVGGILLKYVLGNRKYERIKRDEEAGLNTKRINGLDNQSSIK